MVRRPNTTTKGYPFDYSTIKAVWEKGIPEPGFVTFRMDVCGATMQWTQYGKTVKYGWEIDHIKPVTKGGTDDLCNLQPLQWENNRLKGDSYPDWKDKVKM